MLDDLYLLDGFSYDDLPFEERDELDAEAAITARSLVTGYPARPGTRRPTAY